MVNCKRFAGYPSAVAYENPDGKKAVQHLLWGSFILDNGEKKGKYKVKDVHGDVQTGQYVCARIRGREEDCWIREHEIQDKRCLEVIFVDIGQGDGCLLVTPRDDQFVIDAGEKDNMYRFLRWRFGKFTRKHTFKAAIISHPDADHYKGFEYLFGVNEGSKEKPEVQEKNTFFETVYHNGIVERFGKNSLGPKKKNGRRSYLTDLISNKTELEKFFKTISNWKRKNKRGKDIYKKYPHMLKKALDGKKFGSFQKLSHENSFLPGYGPDMPMSIQILGPVLERPNNSPPSLRWLSSTGKTKNGHSVVLRLQYHNVSILLGGDLNIPSEHLLLSHHTGLDSPGKTLEDQEALFSTARRIFQVDIAKSCHHGSSDFSPLYLKATNPIATVISSGDDEPHSHPRADTLGTTGLHSRGVRPLIFSTELARSTKETIKHPNVLKRDLFAELNSIKEQTVSTEKEKRAKEKKIKEFKEKLDRIIDRSVAVFGAINVVSDGRKVVIAQKLERPRGKDKKWDIYRLEAEGNGPLRYQSKH